MRIIDRYIIVRFLANFVTLFCLLFVFAITIDLILQLDNFVEAAHTIAGKDAGWMKVGITLAQLVANFHGPRVFQFYAYLLGLVSIGAGAFTLAQMHRNRELVAMLAAGVSMQRIAMPFIAAAFALNVMQLLNQEFILPKVAPLLIRKHEEIGLRSAGPFEVRFTRDGNGSLIQARLFDPQTLTMSDMTVLERDEKGRTIRRVTAKQATWDEAQRIWRLKDGKAMRLGSDESSEIAAAQIEEALDAYQTDVTPQVLTMKRFGQFAAMLSLRQIQQMLRTPDVVDAPSLLRYRYSRFAAVCLNLLALAIALPFFLLREPAKLIVQSMLCAAVAIPIMFAALILMTVPLQGIPPALSVFLSPIVLIPAALARMMYLKT